MPENRTIVSVAFDIDLTAFVPQGDVPNREGFLVEALNGVVFEECLKSALKKRTDARLDNRLTAAQRRHLVAVNDAVIAAMEGARATATYAVNGGTPKPLWDAGPAADGGGRPAERTVHLLVRTRLRADGSDTVPALRGALDRGLAAVRNPGREDAGITAYEIEPITGTSAVLRLRVRAEGDAAEDVALDAVRRGLDRVTDYRRSDPGLLSFALEPANPDPEDRPDPPGLR